MTEPEWRAKVNVSLAEIEKRLYKLETAEAVGNVNMTNIESRLAKIEGTLTKLVWLIISAIVVALMGFLVSGGFAP